MPHSIPIIGGPLDGQSYTPVSKRPLYLDDSGKILPPAKGDRVFRGKPHHGTPQTCYTFRVDYSTGARSYVHSTYDVL